MAELLGGFEQAVLLSVWGLTNGAYGRSVLRDTQARLGREVAAGAIYATLDRLEEKGLLCSHLEEGTLARQGRVKRYYCLTAEGVQALNESKAALENLWRGTSWPLVVKA